MQGTDGQQVGKNISEEDDQTQGQSSPGYDGRCLACALKRPEHSAGAECKIDSVRSMGGTSSTGTAEAGRKNRNDLTRSQKRVCLFLVIFIRHCHRSVLHASFVALGNSRHLTHDLNLRATMAQTTPEMQRSVHRLCHAVQ